MTKNTHDQHVKLTIGRISSPNSSTIVQLQHNTPTPAQYSNSCTILQLQHNIHNKKFCNCWLITKITCYEKLTLYSKLKSYWKSSNLEFSLEILKNSKSYRFQNLIDGFAWFLTPRLYQWSIARSIHYCG